jgi:hypothetical protein
VITRMDVPELLTARTLGLPALSIFVRDHPLSSGSRGRLLSAFGIIFFISITIDSAKPTAVLHPNTKGTLPSVPTNWPCCDLCTSSNAMTVRAHN